MMKRTTTPSGASPARARSRACAIALFAVLAAGCNVQHEKVEASIREKLEGEGVELEKVKCPDNVKLEKGGTFECEGSTAAGGDFTVKVEQTDANGSISWELVGRIVDPKDFTRTVAKKAGLELDCGKTKFVAVKGTKMKCKANGKDVQLRFKNDEGDLDVSELEAL